MVKLLQLLDIHKARHLFRSSHLKLYQEHASGFTRRFNFFCSFKLRTSNVGRQTVTSDLNTNQCNAYHVRPEFSNRCFIELQDLSSPF